MGKIITTDGQSIESLVNVDGLTYTLGATEKMEIDAFTTPSTLSGVGAPLYVRLSSDTADCHAIYVYTYAASDTASRMHGIVSGVSGNASGMTNGGALESYYAVLTGDNNDTDQEYVGFSVGASKNGGAGYTIGYQCTGDMDDALIAESGNLGFIEYTPVIYSEWESAVTAATEASALEFGDASTRTWAAGAGPLASQREWYFKAPTYAGNAGGALTITNAATVYIDGPPVAGANMTLTESFALWVDSGDCRFDGLILADGGLIPPTSTNNVSDPPTDAELDTAFGDATGLEDGYIGILDDNAAATDSYVCWVMSGSWFHSKGTKAV